jgi:hypothetical protein
MKILRLVEIKNSPLVVFFQRGVCKISSLVLPHQHRALGRTTLQSIIVLGDCKELVNRV